MSNKLYQLFDDIAEAIPARFVISFLEITPFVLQGSLKAWNALEALAKEVGDFKALPEEERYAIMERERKALAASFGNWNEALEALRAKPDA